MSEIDAFLKPPAKGKPGAIDSFLGTEAPNDPGFVSTIKRTGGQMLTTGATSIEDLTGPNAVTNKVRSVGQGIIDRNPAGIQSLSDIAESPWLTVKEAVGQFVPQVGAAAAGAAGGAAIGRRVAGAPGAAVGAGIGSLVPIFSQEYGGIREDQKEGGQEDKGRALLAAGAATALERVGMGKLLKGMRGELPAMGKIPAEIAKGALKEGGTEAAQTAIEQVGAFKDPTTSESMQEQALAGVMGGIGGGVLGGAHAGAQKVLGGTKKPAGETEQPAAETDQAPGVTQSPLGETLAQVPPTPQAIRAQKLPETGPLSGAVNAGIEATARAAEPPMSEDDMAAALFHVESKRQDGTPQGARFAAEFDAGRISPREALEAFNLERSAEFMLPQPGMAARELSLEEAAALAAPATGLDQSIPVGQATELPVDVVEPAPSMPDEPRAARTPRAEAASIDPRAPNAVAQQIERLRAINTPAAQAFVRDFEAGRITPQDVLDTLMPRAPENVDQRLQAAAARAPAPATAGIVGPDGQPVQAAPRTLRDAQAKRAAEKAAQRQQEEPASAPPTAQQPAAPAAAVVQQPATGALTGAAQAAAVAQPAQVGGESGAPQPQAQPQAQQQATAPAARPDGALIEHVTTKGKTIRGVIRTDLTQDEAIAIDSGTFKKDGPNGRGYFIRERSLDKLAEHDARKAGGSATPGGPGATAAEQPGSATPARRGVPTLEQMVEAYTAANGGGPLPENLRTTATKLHRALAEQSLQTVRDLSHPNNPKSRKVIEQLSGLKLPRGAEQSANIAEQWMRSLHAKPATPQVPASNAAAPVSTQAPAQAGATVAAAPATTTDIPAKRRAVLQALRECLAA